MFYSTLPLLVLVSLGCSASLASPIIEDFESDWTSAVSPFSSSLRRRHFNFDCNDRGKHDRITDEVGFAIEALKITQKELDLNNYYYKNFVPSKEQKNWIDDFKENIYEELINLAADEDYTLRLTCDGTTSQCKEKLGDLRTYAHTDAQTKHINICDAWFTMPKTHDLQQTCDGRTLGAYETGGMFNISAAEFSATKQNLWDSVHTDP
ncbi:MAG: hypothetical protein M1836_005780 [Candelina mexicana]|nr:MAG: hypothetical protein M1836_005780 [Candelina mexicana]